MFSLILLAVIGQGDTPKPKPILAPVPGYKHAVGDIVCVYSRNSRNGELQSILGCDGYGSIDEYITVVRSGDDTGFRKMIDNKQVSSLDSGTLLRILEIKQVYPSDINVSFDILRCRVESKDSPFKDKEVWVIKGQTSLCRLVPAATKAKRRR